MTNDTLAPACAARRRARVAAICTAIALVSLVSSVLARDDGPPPRDPNWIVPPSAAARVNPLAGRSETAAGGEKIFNQRCTACHRQNGQGGPDAPNLTGRAVQRQAEGALFWKSSSGNTRAGMPSFSFMPELQRWQLVLYLRTLAAER